MFIEQINFLLWASATSVSLRFLLAFFCTSQRSYSFHSQAFCAVQNSWAFLTYAYPRRFFSSCTFVLTLLLVYSLQVNKIKNKIKKTCTHKTKKQTNKNKKKKKNNNNKKPNHFHLNWKTQTRIWIPDDENLVTDDALFTTEYKELINAKIHS